jgi:hypothetical protein
MRRKRSKGFCLEGYADRLRNVVTPTPTGSIAWMVLPAASRWIVQLEMSGLRHTSATIYADCEPAWLRPLARLIVSVEVDRNTGIPASEH